MAVDVDPARKPHTIGAVCRALQEEFDDISISKIRYLEDQKLLTPRRTQGGYRLYSDDDIERLRTILRLQRDEFLPLRVIREELTGATISRDGARARPPQTRRGAADPARRYTRDDLVVATGIDEELLSELEEFGLVVRAADRGYGDDEAEIARLAIRFGHYGLGPRHLRPLHSVAQRAAGLVEGVVAPSLRSRNGDRRDAGREDLAVLASLVADLVEQLVRRDVQASTLPD